jgi:hypothetical protein
MTQALRELRQKLAGRRIDLLVERADVVARAFKSFIVARASRIEV